MRTILYTDTDRVRAALGIEDKDIDDIRIIDRDLESELKLDLISWLPTHATLYEDGFVVGATDLQQAIANALALYSTYYCAVLMVKSLQLAAAQGVSDGKNSLNRFPNIDWQALNAFLKEREAHYRNLLLELTAAAAPLRTYNPFVGVGLAVDPVKEGIL